MRLLETFTAGETKRYSLVGHYFRVKGISGAQPGSINAAFWRQGQRLDVDLDGADAGDYAGPFPLAAPFDYFEVTSSEAQSVDLQVMRGPVGSDRITGEVSVIDGGKARTLAGVAFNGGMNLAASVGNFGHIQLWNPAGSGFNVILNTLQGAVTTAADVSARLHNAALTTLVGSMANKLAGGPAGVAEIRTQVNAGILGSGVGRMPLLASSPWTLPMTEPLVITPGWGAMIVCHTVNVAVFALFDCWEESA